MENNWTVIKDVNDYPPVKKSHYWVEKPSGEVTVNFYYDEHYSEQFTRVNVAYMLINEPPPRIKIEKKINDFSHIKPDLRESYLKKSNG